MKQSQGGSSLQGELLPRHCQRQTMRGGKGMVPGPGKKVSAVPRCDKPGLPRPDSIETGNDRADLDRSGYAMTEERKRRAACDEAGFEIRFTEEMNFQRLDPGAVDSGRVELSWIPI